MVFFQFIFCSNELKWIKIVNLFQSSFVCWVTTYPDRESISKSTIWSNNSKKQNPSRIDYALADENQRQISKRIWCKHLWKILIQF